PICSDGLLIPSNLREIAGTGGEIVRQGIERVITAIILFTLLALGSEIEIDAELEAMAAANPAHVVEHLITGCIIDERPVGVASECAEIQNVNLREGTHGKLEAVIVVPLGSEIIHPCGR